MKTLLIIIITLLILSCSKEEQTGNIKFTCVFVSYLGEFEGNPDYIKLVIDGEKYYDDLEKVGDFAWKTKNGFNLSIDSHSITQGTLYKKDKPEILYRALGYFDLKTRHWITPVNPLTINQSAFYLDGIGVTLSVMGEDKN